MNLEKLSSEKIHDQVIHLRAKEKEILSEILEHLREIYKRRYFAKLGYGSLFLYCVKVLKYSEAAAQRRVKALKITESSPELKEKASLGEINLTNLCLLGDALPKLKEEDKKVLLEEAQSLSSTELSQKIQGLTGETKPLRPQVRAHGTSFKLTVKLSKEAKGKLDQVKGLHRNAKKDLSQIMEEALDLYLQTHSPQNLAAKLRGKENKTVTPALKAFVWKRAGGKCEYPGCESVHLLEVEHLFPRGKGGGNGKSNLALLCRSHNVLAAKEAYGFVR